MTLESIRMNRRHGLHSLRVILAFAITMSQCGLAHASEGIEAPLVRTPDVEQDQLEAYAVAENRVTLSNHLDALRPAKEDSDRLRRSLERAQSAWTSGAIDLARANFKDIVAMSLEADWREAQREAILYSYLRLAQTAPTPIETAEWIEKGVKQFTDLQADSSLFPPPLMKSFEEARARVSALAREINLNDHFPDSQIVLVNGRRFRVSGSQKLKLAPGLYRFTALSDSRLPFTEKLNSSQLDVFHLALPMIASGTCLNPQIVDLPAGEDAIDLLYSKNCVRTRTRAGWLDVNSETAAFQKKSDLKSLSTSLLGSKGESMSPGSQFDSAGGPLQEPKPLVSRKTWLWIGLSSLAAASAYAVFSAIQANSGGPEPSHREGF